MHKQEARNNRARRFRNRIKHASNCSEKTRLCVHKTPQHIYAQLFNCEGKVLVAANTLIAEIKNVLPKNYGGNIEAAKIIGKYIAEKAIACGIKNNIVFDRSGYSYHGRIKALADAAREAGLDF